MKLDDPDLVREEYASEAGLLARRSIYENTIYETSEGPLEVTFSLVRELAPRKLLEVGCGPGEMAFRIADELSVEVLAVDISPRMVELARARGVAASVGDIERLPFSDGSFDIVLAAWVLFHVPDLRRGLAEVARVLMPGGHFVAVTNSERHFSEARELAGIDMQGRISFCRENGEQLLLQEFTSVERHDVDGWVTFESRDAVQRYIDGLDSLLERSQRPVDDFEGDLKAGARVTIFVAEKAA